MCNYFESISENEEREKKAVQFISHSLSLLMQSQMQPNCRTLLDIPVNPSEIFHVNYTTHKIYIVTKNK